MNLDSISPWLYNFKWNSTKNNLDLPGQYEGFGTYKPIIEEHIQIIKFEEKVKVFPSLRRPIRLTIHCSNGKNYDYLVKFGEDLRQDQRAQQILNLMSEKLSEDRKCKNHNLFVKTYKVIPILKNSGMITFVQDSMSLNDFLSSTGEKLEPNSNQIFRDTLNKYKQFISKHSQGSTSTLSTYGEAVKNYNIDTIRANFRNLEADINLITANFQDKSILKNGFLQLASSPESYYVLRNNYITSLATMNICNWILGVGDRHLSNILLNIKDGSVTGKFFFYICVII